MPFVWNLIIQLLNNTLNPTHSSASYHVNDLHKELGMERIHHSCRFDRVNENNFQSEAIQFL
jgi:hypothetical protein